MIGYSVPMMKRPNRRVWLARRRRGITATDVPAILGLSPWKTPLDVWLDKTGRTPPVEPNYAMRRGSLLEGLLLTEYATRTGHPLMPTPPLSGHPEDRLALASLDGATEDRVIEIKTSMRTDPDWWDGNLPDHYLAQVAWQQYVTGLPADVFADIGGDIKHIPDIPRSLDFEAYAVPLVHQWWDKHVVANVPPDPDPVRDYQALNLLWHPDPAETIDCDSQTHLDVLAYQAVAEDMAPLEARKKELRGQIRIAMRTATKLIDPFTGQTMASIDKRGTLRITQPKEDT